MPATVCARSLPFLLLAVLAACSAPPSHMTRLWPAGETGEPLLGLSTEAGVLLLADPRHRVGDLFDIQFPVGNSVVREWGRLDRMNDDLAVVVPLTARLLEGRLASSVPAPHEQLYLALRDDRDDPRMVPVRRWRGGEYGNLIEAPGDPEALLSRWAGAGLYVKRDGRWEIAGMLGGLLGTVDGEARPGVGFVGLLEIARIFPYRDDYHEQDVRPLRPDIEYGVPLQPGDIVLPPASAGSQPPAPPSPREGGGRP